jgi:hypothetical protein
MYETKVPPFSQLSPYRKTHDTSAWAKEKGMCTFLSVAQGTHEPAKFLEMYVPFLYAPNAHFSFGFPSHLILKPLPNSHYNGTGPRQPNARPLAFVGKGITFDSGGVSLKPSAVQPSFFTSLSFISVLSLSGTGNETHARRYGGCSYCARFRARHCPTQAAAEFGRGDAYD